MTPGKNPFRSANLRPGTIPYLFPDSTTVLGLIGRFAELGNVAEIRGPHGTGKSTLVSSLIAAWQDTGRSVELCTLKNGQRQLPISNARWRELVQLQNLVLIIDGAEQLRPSTRWLWRAKCKRHRAGLLVTTHRKLGLPTLWETTADSKIANRVVTEILRIDNAATRIDESGLGKLLDSHGGNVREMLFSLYDSWQRT